jgi:N-acylneuraminate cytidylyltransferase
MIVAIIPARGGSKRIPRKNIRPFVGKPIISYSIAAAKKCSLFDRIIVSTDDVEIASVARRFGAETPFVRPVELSDDHVGTNAVIAHALSWLEGQGQPADIACGIYATAPFITVSDLREGYELLTRTGKSFVFAVTAFAFPIQRAIRLASDGGVAPFFPEWSFRRSQDLEEAYHDAGQFYWGQADAFRRDLPLFALHSAPIIVPRFRAIDIDTVEDWDEAELMYAALAARKTTS